MTSKCRNKARACGRLYAAGSQEKKSPHAGLLFLFRIFVRGWWRRGRSLGRLFPARPANRTAQKSWLLLLLDRSRRRRSRCLRRGHRRRTLNNRLRLRRRDWRLETAVGKFAIGSVLIVTVRTLATLIAVAATIATFALIAVDTAVIMRAPVVTIAVLTAARAVTLVAVTPRSPRKSCRSPPRSLRSLRSKRCPSPRSLRLLLYRSLRGGRFS